MFGKFGRLSQLASWILLTINLLVMVCCALTFMFSLWVISSPTTLSETIQAAGGQTLTALLPPEVLTIQLGVALSGIAMVIFFICLMGFYGALTRSPFLLFMYATLTLLLLLLECALLFYFSSSLMEKGLQEDDGQWTHLLRISFRCCDTNSTTVANIYRTEIRSSMPWSCCGTAGYPTNCTTTLSYEKDCKVEITNWIYRYQTLIYTSLAVLHIVLSSCSLMRRSRSASRSGS